MSQRKTNQGQVIDMEGLALKNEKTVAVGNMNSNARGDQLDADGNIVKTKTEQAQAYYANNPKAVVKTVSIKDAIDPIQTKEMESAPVQKAKPKAAKQKSAPVQTQKVKKTVEVELPNGDIEIKEIEE
jgi:hypothetical protein